MPEPLPFYDVTLSYTRVKHESDAGLFVTYEPVWSEPRRQQEPGEPIMLPLASFREEAAGLFQYPAANSGKPAVPGEKTRTFGTMLFEAMIQGRIREYFNRAFNQARLLQQRLRLWMHLPPELENLPVELMYDPTHGLYLGANTQTMLVFGTIGSHLDLTPANYPLKILVIVSEPQDVEAVQVEREIHVLREGLADLIELGMWEIHLLQGPDTLRQLWEWREKSSYHVAHFIGHGLVDRDGGNPALIMEDADRGSRPASTDDLNTALAGYTNLRLVVLNACHGARAADQESHASIAHHLLKLEIAGVIAMQRQIADESAILFTESLYRGIANCDSVDESITAARNSLRLASQPAACGDWFNPRVYLRSANGQLFQTGDGLLPWEQKVRSHLADGQPRSAFAIMQKAADLRTAVLSTRGRVVRNLESIRRRIVEQHDWSLLSELMDYCQQGQLEFSEIDWWQKVAVNRKKWMRDIFAAIEKNRSSRDPLAAGRILQEIDRRIELLHHDDPTLAQNELYEGDAELRTKFWATDSDKMRQFRRSYDGPRLSEPVIRFLELLDQLLKHQGLPLPPPFPLPEPTDENAEVHQILQDVFTHPLGDLNRCRELRQRLRESPPPPSVTWDELIASLHEQLGADLAVVYRAAGLSDRAVEIWTVNLQSSMDRTELLGLHHHLALAGVERDHARPKNREEDILAAWVVLSIHFDQNLPRELLALRPSKAPLEHSDAAWETAERLLIEWLHSASWSQAPGPSAEQASLTFLTEHRAAECLKSLLTRFPTSEGPPLAVGGRGLIRAGWQPRLVAFYRLLAEQIPDREHANPTEDEELRLLRALRQSEANEDATPEGQSITEKDLREMRLWFSSCARAWTACREKHLRDDVLANFQVMVPEAHDSPFEFAGRLPPTYRPELKPVSEDQFAESNPLHIATRSPLELLAADSRELIVRHALERMNAEIAQGVWKSTVYGEPVQVLASAHPHSEELLEEIETFQARAIALVQENWPQAGEEQKGHLLELLRHMTQLKDNPEIHWALSKFLVLRAEDYIDQGHRENAMQCVGEARFRCPHSLDACELYFRVMYIEAENAEEHGRFTAARRRCEELLREMQADSNPRLLAKIEGVAQKARDLLDRLDFRREDGKQGLIDELHEAIGGLQIEDDWRDRLEAAAIAGDEGDFDAALDRLKDAFLLATTEADLEAVRAAFLQLCDKTSVPQVERLILKRVLGCFPEDAAIRQRLRRVEQFCQLIDANDLPPIPGEPPTE